VRCRRWRPSGRPARKKGVRRLVTKPVGPRSEPLLEWVGQKWQSRDNGHADPNHSSVVVRRSPTPPPTRRRPAGSACSAHARYKRVKTRTSHSEHAARGGGRRRRSEAQCRRFHPNLWRRCTYPDGTLASPKDKRVIGGASMLQPKLLPFPLWKNASRDVRTGSTLKPVSELRVDFTVDPVQHS
jgi:hypothetical protein